MAVDVGSYAKCSAAVIDKGANLMGGIMVITGIMAIVLVLSGLFHSVLRRMGQPSVISHILAGIVVGPTFLGRAVDLRELGMKDPGRELGGAIRYLRVLFMFFIGIELDLRYLRRNLRRSVAIASGGFSLCLVFAMLGGTYFYSLMHPGEFPFNPDKLRDSTALFALVLTSTASPVLIRIVTELKLTGSEIGQLAIGAAFANDMASLAALSFVRVRSFVFGDALPTPALKALWLAAMALSLCATTFIASWAARLLNRLNRGRRHVGTHELFGLLLLVTCLAEMERVVGYSNVISGFLMGLAVPREGPTARTIVDRMAYPMHQLIMPVCFAAIGARLDFARVELFFSAWRLARAVAFATLLSAAGNVAGTVVVGRAMGVAPGDAVVLGFLLNVKGYADVMAMNYADRVGVWGETAQAVLLFSSIVNTFMAGPASAAIVRKQRQALQYQSRCLQDLVVVTADDELSVLVCVHGAAGVHSMLALADLVGAGGSAHLLHLVELVAAGKYTITHQLFHHQARGDRGYSKDYDDDGDYDWGNAREIDEVAAAVAAFTEYDDTAAVRQSTAISSLASMDADVRNAAEDTRASLVVVPYHKDLRYDGRMVCRREGRRALNQRVLQRSAPPCTVGVLAERRRLLGEDVTEVVALFRGGPDDREAAAYAARAAGHPMASVTVCRFLFPVPAAVVVEDDEEAAADEEFMADLHARMVATGRVAYTERHVRDGNEMVEALRAMAEMYSLMALGRTGGGDAGAEAVTRDMGGCSGDEFTELGPVGEVLASDEFRGGASVLVLQQHSMHKNKTRKQEQEQPPQAQQSTPPCPC